MKIFTRILLPLFGVASLLAGAAFSSMQRTASFPQAVVSNRFIVEFASVSDITPHKALYQSWRARGVDFQVDKEFNTPSIFVGAALTLSNAQDVTKLQATTGVMAVRPVMKFHAPEPVKYQVMSGLSDPQLPPDTESTHITTGVAEAHALGIIGKDVEIAILDTGIDYTHFALGGKLGAGNKVGGGIDLVGNDYDGTNKPVPKDDPMDCEGHGTFTAGIIGADPGNVYNISGVAYGATLFAYKIYGCVGFTTDDIILQALLLASKEGRDILNLSLGRPYGWTESTVAVVASRIAANGTVVIASAGNDGLGGSWNAFSPGSGIGVTSVGSVDNNVIPVYSATVNGVTHDPIDYYSLLPLPISGDLPIFALSADVTLPDVGCKPLPETTPDLSPFLVIVRRGSCYSYEKIPNIAARGAKAVLLYDDGQGPGYLMKQDTGNVSAAIISEADGQFLVSQFAAKANITISFPQASAPRQFNDPHGGLVAKHSTYGPTIEMTLSPSIMAPGGNVISTVPVGQGSFAVASGTSNSVPHIAGCAALLISVKGRSPAVRKSVRSLLQTTAQRIPSSYADKAPIQTLIQQGAGLVNVSNAIHTTTIVSPSEFLLNDTNHFRAKQPFTVQNIGSTAQTFTLSHVPAGTALTVRPGSIFVAAGPVPLSTQYASVKFSKTSFTVHPGQTRKVVAFFSLPKDVDPSAFAVISGFVQIKSRTESLQISYIGLAAALKNKQVLDNTNTYSSIPYSSIPFPLMVDPSGNAVLAARNYTFVENDFPTLLFRLAFGSPLLRVDLVDHDIKVATTLNTRDSSGQFISFPHHGRGSFFNMKIVGPLLEIYYLVRNANSTDFAKFGHLKFVLDEATFADDSPIPNGSYRFLLRALRVSGDRTNEDDFETFLSPIVNISVKK